MLNLVKGDGLCVEFPFMRLPYIFEEWPLITNAFCLFHLLLFRPFLLNIKRFQAPERKNASFGPRKPETKWDGLQCVWQFSERSIPVVNRTNIGKNCCNNINSLDLSHCYWTLIAPLLLHTAVPSNNNTPSIFNINWPFSCLPMENTRDEWELLEVYPQEFMTFITGRLQSNARALQNLISVTGEWFAAWDEEMCHSAEEAGLILRQVPSLIFCWFPKITALILWIRSSWPEWRTPPKRRNRFDATSGFVRFA